MPPEVERKLAAILSADGERIEETAGGSNDEELRV